VATRSRGAAALRGRVRRPDGHVVRTCGSNVGIVCAPTYVSSTKASLPWSIATVRTSSVEPDAATAAIRRFECRRSRVRCCARVSPQRLRRRASRSSDGHGPGRPTLANPAPCSPRTDAAVSTTIAHGSAASTAFRCGIRTDPERCAPVRSISGTSRTSMPSSCSSPRLYGPKTGFVSGKSLVWVLDVTAPSRNTCSP
jgi:hypothetical protein